MGREHLKKRVRLCRYVVAAFFALRAAVPVGFMPASAAQAAEGLVLVLCPAQGPQSIPHLPFDSDTPHANKATGCPFAASAVALTTPDDGAVNEAPYDQPVLAAVEKMRHATAIFAFIQDARAPPLFLS